jgi:hypothetical protein
MKGSRSGILRRRIEFTDLRIWLTTPWAVRTCLLRLSGSEKSFWEMTDGTGCWLLDSWVENDDKQLTLFYLGIKLRSISLIFY